VSDIFIWGQMMAAAIISTVPMLLLFIFLQRYVVQGLTMGSVKG
jgi:ABC-type glycerol-3-phosphate transport system permease component